MLRNTTKEPARLLLDAYAPATAILHCAGLIAFVLWTPLNVALADDDMARTTASTTDSVTFFESYVRPLLAKRCYECHSSKTGEENGVLVMETAEGIAAGGSRGSMFSKETPSDGLLFRVLDRRVWAPNASSGASR